MLYVTGHPYGCRFAVSTIGILSKFRLVERMHNINSEAIFDLVAPIFIAGMVKPTRYSKGGDVRTPILVQRSLARNQNTNYPVSLKRLS